MLEFVKVERKQRMGKRKTCRGCGADDFILVLSLGETPLANSFLKEEDLKKPEVVYPLDLYYCKRCHLLQLLEVVDPEILFNDYIYVTGTSEGISLHNTALADTITQRQKLTKSDLVVEIGSNDGSLLSCFQKNGIKVLGIEPAKNIVPIAQEKGIETLNRFFGRDCVSEIQSIYGLANVVIANNVLAHVDDTIEFLKGTRTLLKSGGIMVVEVPYLIDMFENLEYDTIYHEHHCYFSILALMQIYKRSGLSIIQVDRIAVHGGSLRIFACSNARVRDHCPEIYDMAESEKQKGFTEKHTYMKFGDKVYENKVEILRLIKDLKERGKTLAGYGAPAKGNTLINFCGITKEDIPYIVDMSPYKVGRYTPGSHIRVYPVKKLCEDQPDYTLLLAWNFKDEIMRQQRAYSSRGGHFILPIPKPIIL